MKNNDIETSQLVRRRATAPMTNVTRKQYVYKAVY